MMCEVALLVLCVLMGDVAKICEKRGLSWFGVGLNIRSVLRGEGVIDGRVVEPSSVSGCCFPRNVAW